MLLEYKWFKNHLYSSSSILELLAIKLLESWENKLKRKKMIPINYGMNSNNKIEEENKRKTG